MEDTLFVLFCEPWDSDHANFCGVFTVEAIADSHCEQLSRNHPENTYWVERTQANVSQAE